MRPTKKAPEECSAGTAGCAQGSRTASTDPRSAAAAAPADAPCGCTGRSPTLRTGSDTAGSGGCRRLPAGRRAGPPAGAPGTAMPAAPRCPPHSLFEPVPAVSVSSCQPPSFVPFSGGFSPLYHICAVIYQRAEEECTNRHSFWGRDPKIGWSHKQKTGLPHSDAEQACLVTEKDPGCFLAGSVILC